VASSYPITFVASKEQFPSPILDHSEHIFLKDIQNSSDNAYLQALLGRVRIFFSIYENCSSLVSYAEMQ